LNPDAYSCVSGRFVKLEQWERWRAKQKLVSGSKRRGGRFCEGPGVITPEKLGIVYAKSCNLVLFWPENGLQCRPECVIKHFNNGNGVLVRFGSFSTMETALPPVAPRSK